VQLDHSIFVFGDRLVWIDPGEDRIVVRERDGRHLATMYACKNEIALGSMYWACSVSPCNRKRTALFFCSVDGCEIHLLTEGHREAWAIEERAPTPVDVFVMKRFETRVARECQTALNRDVPRDEAWAS